MTNEWQVQYRKIGYSTEMVEHPLARAKTMADVDGFTFPDLAARGRFDLAQEVVNRYGEGYAIFGDCECTIIEAAWYLTGSTYQSI